MQLKTGQQLTSVTDTTTVIVIRATPDNHLPLTCGGVAMVGPSTEAARQPILDGFDGGTQIGKRYVDPTESVEVLCTKGGDAMLALGGAPLTIKAAKSLPSSD